MLGAMAACAIVSAGVAGASGCWSLHGLLSERRLRKALLDHAMSGRADQIACLSRGIHAAVLQRAVFHARDGQTTRLPALLHLGANSLEEQAEKAGMAQAVALDGLVTARAEAAGAFCAAGALAGALFSLQLALVAGAAGLAAGWIELPRALASEAALRKKQLEGHLSEAMEVMCLGLRSGLTFDRSLDLYCSCFDTVLARELALAHAEWASGLRTREEALRAVQASYDSTLFGRVVDGIVRSLRFGSPLADTLTQLAAEARAAHKAAVEEAVMKAPVKMMLPVGTLILPSMLLLVMGPVLLELMG